MSIILFLLSRLNSLATESNKKASIVLNFNNRDGNNLTYTLLDIIERKQITDFMDNVLRQLDSKTFLSFTDQALTPKKLMTNKEIYKKLQKRIQVQEENSILSFTKKLSALAHQQKSFLNK